MVKATVLVACTIVHESIEVSTITKDLNRTEMRAYSPGRRPWWRTKILCSH